MQILKISMVSMRETKKAFFDFRFRQTMSHAKNHLLVKEPERLDDVILISKEPGDAHYRVRMPLRIAKLSETVSGMIEHLESDGAVEVVMPNVSAPVLEAIAEYMCYWDNNALLYETEEPYYPRLPSDDCEPLYEMHPNDVAWFATIEGPLPAKPNGDKTRPSVWFLADVLNAANYMQFLPLYHHCAQRFAMHCMKEGSMQGKEISEIQQYLGLPSRCTKDEEKEILDLVAKMDDEGRLPGEDGYVEPVTKEEEEESE